MANPDADEKELEEIETMTVEEATLKPTPEEAKRELARLAALGWTEEATKRREKEIITEPLGMHRTPAYIPYNLDIRDHISLSPWYKPWEWGIVVRHYLMGKYPILDFWFDRDTCRGKINKKSGLTPPFGRSYVEGKITLGRIIKALLFGGRLCMDCRCYFGPTPMRIQSFRWTVCWR